MGFLTVIDFVMVLMAKTTKNGCSAVGSTLYRKIRYWSKKAANLKGLYQKGRTKKAANLKGRKPKNLIFVYLTVTLGLFL